MGRRSPDEDNQGCRVYARQKGKLQIQKNTRMGVYCFQKCWLRGPDLNRRPSGYEPDELPGCSTPRPSFYFVESYFFKFDWLRGPDLNRRPSGYEPDELPGCSTPRHRTACTSSNFNWLRGPDLNRRPSGYEPDELPGCSTPRPWKRTILC